MYMSEEVQLLEIIKDLDLVWFWRGFSCGANSRKKLLQSPNKILNLGKQGIITTLTEKQKISFYIGVKAGRGKIVQNFDIVRVIQYQDKNAHKSKGDYLTASVGSKETTAGSAISLPFSILNNSVDNRGFVGYQYKIKYPTQHLTLNSITPSSSWTGSFEYQHDAESGVVLIQGLKDEVSYEDAILGYLNFSVSLDANGTFTVYMQGPSGKGTGSDILTKINGEAYYIQPITLENGKIKVLGEDEEHDSSSPPIGEPSITVPPIGTVDNPIGTDANFTYDFEFGIEFIDGECPADLVIKIGFGDGSYEMVRIPVEAGTHKYNGKIPLKLPSLKPGPIIIEMWVEAEDEDAVYYWFIKAGALWGFETKIPRDEVGELPIVVPKVSFFEGFRIVDRFRISTEGGTEPEPPTPILNEIKIGEIMQIFDEFESELEGVVEFTRLEDVGITDGFKISFE